MRSSYVAQEHSSLVKVGEAMWSLLKGDLPISDVHYWISKAEDLEKHGIFALDAMVEVLTRNKPHFDQLVKTNPSVAACIMGELLPAIGRHNETNKKRNWVDVRNMFLKHAPALLASAQDWYPEHVGYFLERVINTDLYGQDMPIVNMYDCVAIYSAFIDLLEQKIESAESKYDPGANLLSLKQVYRRVSFDGHLYATDWDGYNETVKVLKKRILSIVSDKIAKDITASGNSSLDYRFLHSVKQDAEYWRGVDASTKVDMGATSINIFGEATGIFLREAKKRLTGRSSRLPTVVSHIQRKIGHGDLSDVDLWSVPGDAPIFYTTAKKPEDVSRDNVVILAKKMSGTFNEVAESYDALPVAKQRKWHQQLITRATHFVEAIQNPGFEELVKETGRVSHRFEYVSPDDKSRKREIACVSVLTTDFFGRTPRF